MKKFLNILLSTLVCLILMQTAVQASSHREAPLISNDPLADNTDVYAFRSPCDTNNVVLIANYIPFQHPAGGPNWYSFSDNVRYEIHVKNQAATVMDDIVYRFTFQTILEDSSTFFRIRLGKENLKNTYTLERSMNGAPFVTIITNGIVPPPNIGPRSIENSTVGLGAANYDSLINQAVKIASTGEKVFAGPMDDPFFVDLGGAFDVGNFRQPGRDGFDKINVHALVVEVPISTLQKDGKNTTQASSILDSDFVIGVYATASRPQLTVFDSTGGDPATSGPWIQVSRLGMPLTNEVVIPIGQKDKWNVAITNTPADAMFSNFLKNPEVALYMDDSQFGTAVPGLARLRIQTNSLQQYDFRNGKPGAFPLKGTPAVAGSAWDDAVFGNYLLPDSASPRAADLLPIFQTGVPNLRPYQLTSTNPLAAKRNNPLAPGKPFVNNFLPTFGDMLRLNMAVPVTSRSDPKFSSIGLVQAAVLGITDPAYNTTTDLQFIPNMDGFPNGRRLEDDITTIELQAVGGIVLAAIGFLYDDYDTLSSPSPVTPKLLMTINFDAGITQNDTMFKACYPYLQAPWRGFNGAQYVGPRSTVVPVSFLDFTAKRAGNTAILNWRVTNEINNDHYEIEQSAGNGTFKKIGTVNSTQGGSSIKNYQFIHTNPDLNNTNFYRIRQVDFDGKSSISTIRLVKFSGSIFITVSPNPASNFININSSSVEPLDILLFDQNGKKVSSQKINSGSTKQNISKLANGVYLLVVKRNGVTIETIKVAKQ